MYKILLGAGILIVLSAGGYFFLRGAGSGTSENNAIVLQPLTMPNTDSYSAATAPETQPSNAAVQNTTTQQAAPVAADTKKYMQAVFHTNKGDITIEFSSETPNTVANFEKLVQSGFYNSTKFHRVIPGFMIQGGDPLTKDDSLSARWGTGGPGYQFNDEITAQNSNAIGTIAMANSGPNTNGSQFFINVADNHFLDTKHTVFGHVVVGMDIVKAISASATNPPNDVPKDPILISSITLK